MVGADLTMYRGWLLKESWSYHWGFLLAMLGLVLWKMNYFVSHPIKL